MVIYNNLSVRHQGLRNLLGYCDWSSLKVLRQPRIIYHLESKMAVLPEGCGESGFHSLEGLSFYPCGRNGRREFRRLSSLAWAWLAVLSALRLTCVYTRWAWVRGQLGAAIWREETQKNGNTRSFCCSSQQDGRRENSAPPVSGAHSPCELGLLPLLAS